MNNAGFIFRNIKQFNKVIILNTKYCTALLYKNILEEKGRGDSFLSIYLGEGGQLPLDIFRGGGTASFRYLGETDISFFSEGSSSKGEIKFKSYLFSQWSKWRYICFSFKRL